LAELQRRTAVELPTAARITFAHCYRAFFIYPVQFKCFFMILSVGWKPGFQLFKIFGRCLADLKISQLFWFLLAHNLTNIFFVGTETWVDFTRFFYLVFYP
jgi:hypothetical protein